MELMICPRDDSVSREPFSKSEVQKLCAAAPNDEWRVFILLGALAGLRIRDAANLKWRNVDLLKQSITFEPQKQRRSTKSKKVLVIPIHKSLQALLELLPSSDSGESYLLPSLAEIPTSGRKGLSMSFLDLMDQAGIQRDVVRAKKDGAKRQVSKRSFHSLRHTANTWMAHGGVSQERRRQVVGHSDNSTNDIYTHWEKEQLEAAIEVMPTIKL